MSSRTFYDHFEAKDDLVADLFMSQARRFFAERAVLAQRTRGAVARCEQGIEIFCDLFPSASTIDFERLGGDAAERVRAERRRVVNLIADTIVGEGVALYPGARSAIARRPRSSSSWASRALSPATTARAGWPSSPAQTGQRDAAPRAIRGLSHPAKFAYSGRRKCNASSR
jgi:AcrR family transcriptional regulator